MKIPPSIARDLRHQAEYFFDGVNPKDWPGWLIVALIVLTVGIIAIFEAKGKSKYKGIMKPYYLYCER